MENLIVILIIIFGVICLGVMAYLLIKYYSYNSNRDEGFARLARKYNLEVTYDYKDYPINTMFGGKIYDVRTLKGSMKGTNVAVKDQVDILMAPLVNQYQTPLSFPTWSNGFKTRLVIDGVEKDITNKSFWSSISFTPVEQIDSLLNSLT